LRAIRKIESRGNIDTAHRALQVCGQIFRFAIATDRGSIDFSLVLKGALTPVRVKHHPSITSPKDFGRLLIDIDNYEGAYLTQQALKLAPLVFVRQGELRHAEWADINFEKKEWRIPAEKMKMRKVHIIPLSKQALRILQDIKETAEVSNYLFPCVTSINRPMSENTVNMALKRMGYRDRHTAHGFRSTASTILHEQGWAHDVIELQLAHKVGNAVAAAYNYATYIPERQKMMQHWADYLDNLRKL
jgi:integrase